MAEELGLTEEQFLSKYARKLKGNWSLNEIRGDRGFDCVFLKRDEKGRGMCSIYKQRPAQCKTWPFWPFNMKSIRTYINVAKATPCIGMLEGLDGKGEMVDVEEIRIRMEATPDD